MHRNHCPSSPVPHGGGRLLNVAAVLALAFVVSILAGCSGPKQAVKSAPTQEEKAYLQNIQITPGPVEAAKNFLNHTVTTVHGTMTNNGKKSVLYLKITLTFSDIEGKPIKQETATPVSGHTLPLSPGQTRAFKVAFDEVPPMWNQAPPQMAPARVILAGE